MSKQAPAYLDIPPVSSIPAMVSGMAESVPDKTAFRFRKGRDNVEGKTYRDVCEDVRRCASFIAQRFGAGNHMAVIGENSYEWVLAYFSILASGNVAVPLDKALPANEIVWMLSKAEVRTVFVSGAYEDLTEGAEGVETVSFKKLASLQGENWENFAFVTPAPDDLACILFTSGTSGRSKGVMLTHGNLAADTSNAVRNVELRGMNSLAVLPFHHAFGLVPAIFCMYHVGEEIFLNRSLKQVKADILLAKPRLMFLVPLFVEEFNRSVNEGIKKEGKEKKVKTGLRLSSLLLKIGIDVRRKLFREILEGFGGELRLIISGGARLDPTYQETFRNFGIEIHNGYGASECSPVISVEGVFGHRPGSVGPALDGVEIKISPDDEVLVRGPIVTPGYYHDPEETAKSLQDGWYATGDLGRLDEDGFLYLTGRKKNLIILSNGENISPEELENDFEADPAVRAVMVYENEKDQTITAEIYPEDDFLGNQEYFEALRLRVNGDRPAYKQVNRVVLRNEDFIRNTSQKIVRFKNIPKE